MQRLKHYHVLVILLLNRPSGHLKSKQWKSENLKLLQQLSSQYIKLTAVSKEHRLLQISKDQSCNYDVLLLDFNDKVFDANAGVGLARRIAADTALSLIDAKLIKNPWIFSTDADVILPRGYFETILSVPKQTAALSLKFKHTTDSAVQQRLQQQYDFKLHYYQQGVKYIGAAYDYIPLGSTLIVEGNSYAKVRGFPCRSGGEDFYILNKLAKIGSIYQPTEPTVEIQTRFSDRVPFGTGPAISQIQQQQNAGKDYLYYHPEIFIELQLWHRHLLSYYHHQDLPINDRGLNKHWNIDSVLDKAFTQITTEQRWHQFIHEWFDAFRILKSVHFLRHELKSIPKEKLIESKHYKKILSFNEM